MRSPTCAASTCPTTSGSSSSRRMRAEESISVLRRLAPPGVPVVMSSAALGRLPGSGVAVLRARRRRRRPGTRRGYGRALGSGEEPLRQADDDASDSVARSPDRPRAPRARHRAGRSEPVPHRGTDRVRVERVTSVVMTKLAAHGLAIGLPIGWEGRIQRRAVTTTAAEQHVRGRAPRQLRASGTARRFRRRRHARDAFARRVRRVVRVRAGVARFAVVRPAGDRPRQRRHVRFEAPAAATAGSARLSTVLHRQRPAVLLYVVAGSRASLPRIIAQVNAALAGLDIEP